MYKKADKITVIGAGETLVIGDHGDSMFHIWSQIKFFDLCHKKL